MPTIDQVLSAGRLERLRASYDSPVGKQEKEEVLRGTLDKLYEGAGPYTDAINEIFYRELPPDTDTERDDLSEADRERCVIALLAAQGGGVTLAVHIYLGLMTGLSPKEIGHILLLAGVYAGINRFAEAIFVTMTTLEKLETLPVISPNEIVNALKAHFLTKK